MKFGIKPRLEFASPAAQHKIQESLLRRHLANVLRHSPFYSEQLAALKIRPARFRLADLASLPFTDKAVLEERNDEFLASPASRVVDIVLSSGTTGKPTRIMYTEQDLQRLAYNEKISFASCGFTADDVVLLTCTMDRCFVAGLAYFLGIRSLGAAAIRNGNASLDSHAEILQRLKPTALVGVPTFLRKLGLFMKENGLDPASTAVRKLVCIGEPLRDAKFKPLKLGVDLEALWKAKAFSTYASSEIVTTFCECRAQQGGHLHPDLGIVEIVDEQGRPVPSGTPGEIVVTPLAVEGMPLIRFKTGDVSFLVEKTCACGRHSPRLGPIIGRKKQMLKVRGTTLYPQAIFSALEEIPGMSEYYLLVSSQDDLSDDIEVHVAAQPGFVVSVEQVEAKLQSRLRVKPRVRIEPVERVRQQVFTAKSRKPIRFFDLRIKN